MVYGSGQLQLDRAQVPVRRPFLAHECAGHCELFVSSINGVLYRGSCSTLVSQSAYYLVSNCAFDRAVYNVPVVWLRYCFWAIFISTVLIFCRRTSQPGRTALHFSGTFPVTKVISMNGGLLISSLWNAPLNVSVVISTGCPMTTITL
jgi:hypothetical protein